jgi:conjugal transfer pilus assembly protein TraB
MQDENGTAAGSDKTSSRYQAHLDAEAARDRGDSAAPRASGIASSRDIKAHWQALSAKQKLRVKQASVAMAVALLGYGLYTASSGSKDQPEMAANAAKLDMGAGLRGDSLETKLHGDLKKIIDGQQQLGDRVTAIEEGKVQPAASRLTLPRYGRIAPGAAGHQSRPHHRRAARRAAPKARATSTACRLRPRSPPVLSRRLLPPHRPSRRPSAPSAARPTASCPLQPRTAARMALVPDRLLKKTRTIFLPPGFMKRGC